MCSVSASRHSPAFQRLRDEILALGEPDRRQLAALTGAMHAPQPAISRTLAAILGLIAELDEADRRRLARWSGQFVSRWGQVPVAPSHTIVATGGVVGRSEEVPGTAGISSGTKTQI